MFCYYQDKFTPSQTLISSKDRSFLLGDGFFTTFKIEQGRVLFLEQHLTRLQQTAAILGMPWIWSFMDLITILSELYHLNHQQSDQLRVRVTVSRGEGQWGVLDSQTSHLFISCSPWQVPLGPKSLMVSSQRLDEQGILSCYKTTSRLNYVLAHQQAQQAHTDEALLLNLRGTVLCASSANIWMVDDEKRLITPKGGLQGVTKEYIKTCFSTQAFEEDIHIRQLETAKVLFLSSSMLGMHQAYLNDRTFTESALFASLQSDFNVYCQQHYNDLLNVYV